MRRVMVVIDPDETYGTRLVSYFNTRACIGFKASAFSDLQTYKEFRQSVHVEILLISEAMAPEAQGMTDGAKVILLSEDGFIGNGDHRPFSAPAVFKYLPADGLAREIMQLYADDRGSAVSQVHSAQCEIFGVYSPVNRCGKTTLALTLGFVKAARGKTLLISLEEYAGIFSCITKETDSDLSDIIYCYLQGSYSWSRLKSMVHSFGPLDFIPPVRCMEDISQISSEDLATLFRRIAEESRYASIIIDFGSFGRRALELIELCGRVFMPVTEDLFSELKLNSFFEYLEKSGKEELKDRLIKCVLPREEEKAKDYARAFLSAYESGALYEYASRLH